MSANHPRMRPNFPAMLAFWLGVFSIVAAVGTWVPAFIYDRYVYQFLPITAYFVGQLFGESAASSSGPAVARVAQGLIGSVELLAGVILVAGAFDRRRRLRWINLGCCLLVSLYSVFILTLFILHHTPPLDHVSNWAQFPAIFAWVALTWFLNVWWAPRGP